MPRFDYHYMLDHRIDNQIVEKKDLRFHEQDTAEEFATAQYLTDFIPRSVILGLSGMYMVLECPTRTPETAPHPQEVFYINSAPVEG